MKKKQKNRYLFPILSLLLIIMVIPLAIRRMNEAVIDNVRMAGEETAHVYALNEVILMNQYETILETLEYQLRPEHRTGSCQELIAEYLTFANEVMDLDEVEAYAAIDGRICAATYWEGDETFDPVGTVWYESALEADGEIIYTDAYTDARLEKTVVTLAMRIRGTRDVVAVDAYPSYEPSAPWSKEAPEGTNYFVCDAEGTLLSYTIQGYGREELQSRFDGIFQAILNEEDDISRYGFTGVDGQKRGIYSYRLDSGWYAVVTIPFHILLEPYGTAWQIFLSVILVFVLTVVIFAGIDYRTGRKARVSNEIVGVLSNSYYALYQIDLRADRYYMMKGSDYVRKRLPARGDYGRLLELMRELIQEQDYEEFVGTFSAENMAALVEKRVRDFGGDFKRLFNGEYRWVHVQMLYDESIQKGTVVLAFRDVNEAKEEDLSRLELLKTSLESADRMAESKNMFFSQMSHDMRTPLNGIIGLAGLAERDVEDPGRMRETLEKIRKLGGQLLELINEILDISRIEAGKVELRSERFPIRRNLEELIALHQPQTEAKGKRFLADLNVRDEYVEGDWGKLQQILNNILSNAVKYTGSDGVIEMEVGEDQDSNSRYRKYCFRISDNGAGMSREFLEKLYVPFEREVKFGAARVAGTGLGMPIVHELVQKMEGTIEVEIELGRGTTFRVTLPFRVSRPAERTAAATAEESQAPGDIAERVSGLEDAGERERSGDERPQKEQSGEERPRKEQPRECLQGRCVLLAEDNEINMEIGTEMLCSFGIKVLQAWNGKDAAELYMSCYDEIDLILLDMQMPVMDGCEAAERIRRSGKPGAREVPVIAVTANAFAEDIARTRRAGMNAHISKPIDFRILKETMEMLLTQGEEQKSEG